MLLPREFHQDPPKARRFQKNGKEMKSFVTPLARKHIDN